MNIDCTDVVVVEKTNIERSMTRGFGNGEEEERQTQVNAILLSLFSLAQSTNDECDCEALWKEGKEHDLR